MYLFDVYIYNISVPSYLTDILPPRISETTNYPLGNSEDFTIRSYRLIGHSRKKLITFSHSKPQAQPGLSFKLNLNQS
jgi:hypothetical protein